MRRRCFDRSIVASDRWFEHLPQGSDPEAEFRRRLGECPIDLSIDVEGHCGPRCPLSSGIPAREARNANPGLRGAASMPEPHYLAPPDGPCCADFNDVGVTGAGNFVSSRALGRRVGSPTSYGVGSTDRRQSQKVVGGYALRSFQKTKKNSRKRKQTIAKMHRDLSAPGLTTFFRNPRVRGV